MKTNVKIIGTTHLMNREEIESILKLEKPDVIGVELCNTRLNMMVINKPQELKQDDSLIGKIANAVKKKADEQKIEYGSDMITASHYALDNKIPLVLCDMDILVIRELMEKIPENEKIGFLTELSNFEQQSLSKEVNEEETLKQLKSKYPIAFEFLITLRNKEIENNILKSILKYPKKNILIFLGKGHVKEIASNIEW